LGLILRASSLFWLDNYCCANDKKKMKLTRLIEMFRYTKLKWVMDEKMEMRYRLYLFSIFTKP